MFVRKGRNDKLRNRISLLAIIFSGIFFVIGFGCHSDSGGPKELLNKYFSSAMKEDYATAYTCYYGPYKEKISKDEYIRHRKEASVLLSYEVKSITQNGDSAQAQVELSFGPSQKLKRTQPTLVAVKEDIVRENGEWKIKVW